MAFEFIPRSLEQRRQQHLLRNPVMVDSSVGAIITVQNRHYLNFSSNDYLGQRQSQQVMQAWVEGIAEYGVGSGSSPLVTGHTKSHQQLEDYLADQLNRDRALLFSSGFAANQAITQALLHKDADVISDKLMHASFIDGAMHSDARFRRFRHNDLDHLDGLLGAKQHDTLVATEGVFSMDGDDGELAKISQRCVEHDAWLMVDDAHGIGVRGKTGLGSIQDSGLSQHQVPIVMGTFGKAIGTAGAFIAGSDDLISYLINFAKHYIYSTAMPPALAHATLVSFQQIADAQQQQKLMSHIARFQRLCNQAKIPVMASNSAIQPVIIGDPQRCTQVSEKLKQLGIWVSPIRYPTVSKHTDRLRITLSASHHDADIDALVDGLALALTPTSQSQ
ncbi:8-amino-7-oxononanoate synthase [Aliiglaciecola litoralis]|uniref:8-amino-7-oxononanoate synthase n=1 Tax=Aliiglaciecola litoralis TaxID=582857 RepID=A0ABN1LEE5_9ALTE